MIVLIREYLKPTSEKVWTLSVFGFLLFLAGLWQTFDSMLFCLVLTANFLIAHKFYFPSYRVIILFFFLLQTVLSDVHDFYFHFIMEKTSCLIIYPVQLCFLFRISCYSFYIYVPTFPVKNICGRSYYWILVLSMGRTKVFAESGLITL